MIQVQLNDTQVLMQLDADVDVSVKSGKIAHKIPGIQIDRLDDIMVTGYSGKKTDVRSAKVTLKYEESVGKYLVTDQMNDSETLFGFEWLDHIRSNWEMFQISKVKAKRRF